MATMKDYLLGQTLRLFEKYIANALKKYGFEEKWLNYQNIQIHSYQKHTHAPNCISDQTVVLIHGLGSTASGYGKLMAKLSPYFDHIIAISAPAHGLSQSDDLVFDQEKLFSFWATLLNEIQSQSQKPLIIIGTSLGGAISLKYSTSFPDRLSHLILCSPAGAPLTQSEILELKQTFNMDQSFAGWRFLKKLYHQPPMIAPLLAPLISYNLGDAKVQKFLGSIKEGEGITPEELLKLKAKTLLIWGQKEKILPKRHIAYYKTNLLSPDNPIHQSVSIHEPLLFSHSPHLESTHELVEIILDFIKKHRDDH